MIVAIASRVPLPAAFFLRGFFSLTGASTGGWPSLNAANGSSLIAQFLSVNVLGIDLVPA